MITLNQAEYFYLQEKYKEDFMNLKDYPALFCPNTHVEPEGDTLLHALAYRGDFVGCAMLIEVGANVNSGGDFGYTPLQYAIQQNRSIDTTLLLMQNGADFSIENEFGHSAINTLFEEGVDLSDVLNKKWSVKKTLASLDIQYVESVLNIEIDINEVYSLKKALYESVDQASLTCLYLLLNAGVNPCETVSSDNSFSAVDAIKKLAKRIPYSVSNSERLSGVVVDKVPLTKKHKDILFWFQVFLNREIWQY